jgi:uncharacterized membrane-anchored protein YitT (DUF2179 family)
MKRNYLVDVGLITLGIFLMAAGFYYFMVPYNLITGGIGGLAIVIQELFQFDVLVLVYVFNVSFLLLGWLVYGTSFFLKTILGSLVYPVALTMFALLEIGYALVPLTDDLLLAVIFSAVLMGGGFGLVIRHGGTTGGADIPIKIIYDYFKIPFSTAVYIVDGTIVVLGTLVFGLEIGMYSVVAVFLIGFISDYVVTGGTKTISINIITDHAEAVKELIYQRTERGVSMIPITGGYSKSNKTMLLCVAFKKEYYLVIQAVHEIDKKAFVFVNTSSEVLGEGFDVPH